MSSGEIPYTFRVALPDLLERGRNQRVRLEAYRDGVRVQPVSGTFTLFAPDGTALVDGENVTIVDEAAIYDLDGTTELGPDVEVSELYQERWILTMPEEGAQPDSVRTVRREAVVAPFSWFPPVTDADLVEQYPRLLEWISEASSSAQGFIDGATRKVLRKLFKSGRWPDLMLSHESFHDTIVELALYWIFRDAFRNVAGGNRFERLMDIHKATSEREWNSFTSRIDSDLDGLPDDRSRQSASTVIHRNVGPFRRRRRTPRW